MALKMSHQKPVKRTGSLGQLTTTLGAAEVVRIKHAFIQALRGRPNPTMAAVAAGVGLDWILQQKALDKDFQVACTEAWELHVDRLEETALTRAIDGWLEEVYQGGVKVGHRTVVSPQLMLGMLRANRREKYGEKVEVTVDPQTVVAKVKSAILDQDAMARDALGLAPLSSQMRQLIDVGDEKRTPAKGTGV